MQHVQRHGWVRCVTVRRPPLSARFFTRSLPAFSSTFSSTTTTTTATPAASARCFSELGGLFASSTTLPDDSTTTTATDSTSLSSSFFTPAIRFSSSPPSQLSPSSQGRGSAVDTSNQQHRTEEAPTMAMEGTPVTMSVAATAAVPPSLPDPPYGLPERDPVFTAERLGRFDQRWLTHDLPRDHDVIAAARALPSKDSFWALPPHEALTMMAQQQPYHDTLRLVMEHGYFFLMDAVMHAADAPLPHVQYEDFMKCMTFASLQNPPEEQFALPASTLRTLLCVAAYHCTVDPHYHTSSAQLFRKIEQQQRVGPEVLSAWVYVCTAAGKLEEALSYARHMAAHDIPFDPEVFSLLLHPSVHPLQLRDKELPHVAKGVVLQQRLCEHLQTVYAADTIAVHAMFVYHALTLRHTAKWEVLRRAVESAAVVVVAPRTLALAFFYFVQEKGVRCGARTVKAMVRSMARPDSGCTASELLYVLMRVRKNELSPALAGLPRTAFSEYEQAAVMSLVLQRVRREEEAFRVAAPLVHALMATEESAGLFAMLSDVRRSPSPNAPAGAGASKESGEGPNTTLRMSVQGVTGEPQPQGQQHEEGADGRVSSADSLSPPEGHREAHGKADDQVGAESDAVQHAESSSSSVVTLRDLLREVQQLERQPLLHYRNDAEAAGTDGTLDVSSSTSAPPSPSALLEALKQQGVNASQRAWTRRVLHEQEELQRLQRAVRTAWVSPGYEDGS